MNFTIFFSPSGTLTFNLQFPLVNLFLLNFFLSFVYKEFSLLFFLALLYLARRSELFPYIYRANNSKLTFLLIHPRFSSYINGNFSSLALSSARVLFAFLLHQNLLFHFPSDRSNTFPTSQNDVEVWVTWSWVRTDKPAWGISRMVCFTGHLFSLWAVLPDWVLKCSGFSQTLLFHLV